MLLIDEIDRADEEFEAFLLEVLSDFQVTIPEIGTIKATQPPYVILTSNRIRELSDALRRRCLYLWIDFPGFDKEVRIVDPQGSRRERAAGPGDLTLHGDAAHQSGWPRCPGVAETLDWAQALSVAARRPPRRGARGRDARLRPQGRRRHEALPRGAGEAAAQALRSGQGWRLSCRLARPRSRRDAASAALLRAGPCRQPAAKLMDAVRALEVVDLDGPPRGLPRRCAPCS